MSLINKHAHSGAFRLSCRAAQYLQAKSSAFEDPKVLQFLSSTFCQLDRSVNKLSILERSLLQKRFFQAHSYSLKMAVWRMRRSHESSRPIDPTVSAIRFNLTYRADNDGNPAKVFRVKSVEIVPLSAPERAINAETHAQCAKQWAEEKEDEFVAPQCVILVGDLIPDFLEPPHTVRLPLVRLTPADEAELDGSNALWDWFDNVNQTIELGMVWATTNMEEQRHDPGEMCKEGKQWKWKHVPSKAQDESQSVLQHLVSAGYILINTRCTAAQNAMWNRLAEHGLKF